MTDCDFAWAAGLFEGEGYVTTGKNGYPQAGIDMIDLDIIQRFKGVINFGNIRQYPGAQENNKIRYRWVISGVDRIRKLLNLLYKWLSKNRINQINSVLSYIPKSISRNKKSTSLESIVHTMISNNPEIAWAIGLFEGEGCVYACKSSKTSKRSKITMTVTNTDFEVIKHFKDAVDCGVIYKAKKRTSNRKDSYSWRCFKREEVDRLCILFFEDLGTRRQKQFIESLEKTTNANAKNAIEDCGKSDPIVPSQYGYNKHRRNGQKPCDSCKKSFSLYQKLRRLK
jgi:hypothetical protein